MHGSLTYTSRIRIRMRGLFSGEAQDSVRQLYRASSLHQASPMARYMEAFTLVPWANANNFVGRPTMGMVLRFWLSVSGVALLAAAGYLSLVYNSTSEPNIT